MSIFRKVLCTMGRHSGPWSYPGGRCEMARVCDFCGKNDKLTRHTWSAFADADSGQCSQVRRCGRCDATESRSEHEWGPWLYLNTEFTSPQVRRCRRCHAAEKTSYTMR
jgi:hypothetical protein